MSLPMVIVAGPWWGKAFGSLLGAVLGGWLGALLGLALGYLFDERLRLEPYSARTWRGCALGRAEQEFLTATFAVMGHVAKADGRVSGREVETAERIMARLGLDTARRQRAIYLFTRGKAWDFPMAKVLRRFNGVTGHQPELLERFLRCVLEIAHADGPPCQRQQRVLLRIVRRLGIHPSRLEELARSSGSRPEARPAPSPQLNPLLEACRRLGVAENASNEEITRAYRRAIGREHPDRLQAAGASEAELREAHVRTQAVREAYEEIRRARGF